MMAIDNGAESKATGLNVNEVENGSRSDEKAMNSSNPSDTDAHSHASLHGLEVSSLSIRHDAKLIVQSVISTSHPLHSSVLSCWVPGSLLGALFSLRS